jgi:hypothetical protein
MSRQKHTEPPFPSFRIDSQTLAASLKSPKIVANSAKRRCWGSGFVIPPTELGALFWILGRTGTDDGTEDCTGLADGDAEPNKRRVEEKRREGSRRDDES